MLDSQNALQIDKILSNILGVDSSDIINNTYNNSKKYSIEETENEYFISIDIPGYSKNEVNLDFTENTLVVTGKNEKRGDFNLNINTRHLRNVDVDNIRADLKLGVLIITLDKYTRPKPTITWC